MRKAILSIIVLMLVSMSSIAQSEHTFSFSIGPELSFATGSFSATHSVGTGGTVQAEILIQDKLKATATFGVMAYLGRSYNSSTKYSGQTIVPVRVGAKYFLTGGVYAAAQIGVAFVSSYAPYKGTAFAYSPLMLGYEFKTKSDKTIDATIKYDGYSGSGGTIGAFGIRLAYVL